jgi:predicted dienelactone hydrolase
MLKQEEITSVPADVLSRTRVDAYTDARPAGRAHSLPLVVLSPGFKQPRSTLSGLAEDLASHGYVVAAIDHTYENVAETFPDGRVTTCAACGHYDAAFWTKLEQGRAADVSFVLDQLTGERARVKGAALIDPHRIAMAGHSVGGSSAQAAMVRDGRLLAGIDIDGTTDGALPKSGLGRPFMFFGKPATYTPGTGNEAASWESDWKRLTGWKRWILVTGTVHQSFTDLAALADELGLDAGNDLPGSRSLQITRTYVRAFFDRHLRHRHRPLLDRPSKRYPEVRFCDPETKTCE